MTLASASHERINVALGDRSYDIVIGTDVLARAGELMKPVLKLPKVIIVTDDNVAPLHLEALQKSLDQADIAHEAIIMPAGESTKSFENLSNLMNDILGRGLERKSCLVALGGGVIGDLTGFAAAIAMRGIEFVQIPTTLLAQVDSSVGGKTGINVPAGKNLVGAFHQPKMVLADMTVLDSLPKRDLLAGYAEVVKYGALGDEPFFTWLESHGQDLIDGAMSARIEAVKRSCLAKANIVAQDEKEGGVRALLNLGHTFGHALESAVGYGGRLVHGEAVAIGMVMAFDLSVAMGLCPSDDAARLRRHLAAVGLPTDPTHIPGMTWNTEDLIARMATDKKVADGNLTFILARSMGDSFITQDVKVEQLALTVSESIGETLLGD
ncbi:3-dehydroquinate synthase [Curvivirga aplysinae]|uniref:3-dehydroquinate synthase n=1 Tax=Curvivirga aplysinae TaxID=2529852 RepID=UPI0038B38C73